MIGGRIFPAISHNPVTTFAMIANRPRQAKPKNTTRVLKKALFSYDFPTKKAQHNCVRPKLFSLFVATKWCNCIWLN